MLHRTSFPVPTPNGGLVMVINESAAALETIAKSAVPRVLQNAIRRPLVPVYVVAMISPPVAGGPAVVLEPGDQASTALARFDLTDRQSKGCATAGPVVHDLKTPASLRSRREGHYLLLAVERVSANPGRRCALPGPQRGAW